MKIEHQPHFALHLKLIKKVAKTFSILIVLNIEVKL